MAFEYEREMTEPAVQWLRGQGLMVKREFPTPWGICDLVGCSLNKRKVDKRIRQKQTKPIRSQLRVHLLSLIPDEGQGSVGVDDLHRVFDPYLDRERIERELMRLRKDRFAQPAGHDTFYKINGWMPLHKRLIAVELKLARVNDALHQAVNNLGFADESFVALPGEAAKRLARSKKKEEFRTEGVGVLAVTPRGCKVILASGRRSARSERVVQTYAVERFWLPHLKGNEA
jgi:hypothetical protein